MVRGNTAMRAREVRDAFERGQREAYDFGWRTGKKAGIKEVVGWVEKYTSLATIRTDDDWLPMGTVIRWMEEDDKLWQAKLKEWGIDDRYFLVR